MAEVVCYRSLWATLTAAVSSLALFAAAHRGISGFFGIGDILVFVMPVAPFHIIVTCVLCVWEVRNMCQVAAASQNTDHLRRCISIIALCPLYIQIPGGVDISPELQHSCDRVGLSREQLLDQECLLELRPAHPSGVDMQVAHNLTVPDQWVCLEIKTAGREQLPLKCRAAILKAGLAPNQKQLSLIRGRSRFQSVVTALQAGGCVLSVLQRLLQHLGISPVEAISAFLGILAAVQLLTELYVCWNYQCPLLLCLDAPQLVRLENALHDLEDYQDQEYCGGKFILGVFMVVWLAASVPALFYFAHYVHTHFISALSALLFFLSQTLILSTFLLLFFDCLDSLGNVFTVSSVVVYGGCLIVAIVGTIVEWKAFHNPAHDWFAWILPHVAS